MAASIYDLPPEILYSIADLVQSPTSSDARTVRACASSCRLLRSIFRPLVWSRVEISASFVGSGPRQSKGKKRVVKMVKEKGNPRRGTVQLENEGGTGWNGISDGVCDSDPPFIRALAALGDILAASPEITSYVKELDVDLPSEDGFGFSSPGTVEEDRGERGFGNGRGDGAGGYKWEDSLFPRIAARLTNLRKLSVASYHCQRRSTSSPTSTPVSSSPTVSTTTTTTTNGVATPRTSPPRFRVDWDVLSPGLRSGFTTLFKVERLEEVELLGVVVPPRMLFGSGIGMPSTDSGVLTRLKKLALVAHCPISRETLEQIERFGVGGGFTVGAHVPMTIASTLHDDPNAFQATSPLLSAMQLPRPRTTLTSLRLGFCDSVFLQYLSSVYPAAFTGLKSLSLNIIERDLGWCQGFLDILASGSPSTAESASSSALAIKGNSAPHLESFDCTIRCNTQASYQGLFTVHALDFSRCVSLKHLTLRYLLLSQVTEAVTSAMGVNVASALSSCRLGDQDGRKGVESVHLVVDWAFNGDYILLQAFHNLDRIVKDAYYTSSNGEAYGGRRKSLNLKQFKIEATHWPCLDAGNCGFRRQVVSPPPSTQPTCISRSSSPSPGSSSGSDLSSTTLSKRPTPLRTSSSPHPHRSVGFYKHPAHASVNEGSLDKFFPFLTRMRGIRECEDGVEFESRYVLEHRREIGIMV